MSYFRHPKTQNERKQDAAAIREGAELGVRIHGRIRSGSGGRGLPSERDDKVPSNRADKYRRSKHARRRHSSA